MANPHVVVSGIRSLSRDASPGVSSLLPPAVTVHFDDDQVARLHPEDPGFEWRQAVLADFQRVGLPVYATLSAPGGVIETLLLPLSGIVVYLARDAAGDVTFHLHTSAKPFVLRSSDPKYSFFLHILKEAQLDRAPVLVTEDEDGSNLVDIRRDPNPPPPVAVKTAILAPAIPEAVHPVAPGRADELFQLVAAASCIPARPEPGCIPFLFPDNGCHSRAHRACALIMNEPDGVQPLKVWNYPSDRGRNLVFKTRYAPHCKVQWGFHVAVQLAVRNPGESAVRFVVLDPALFPEGAVTVSRWKGVQGDPASRLAFTSSDQYLPPYFDVDNVDPDRDLVYWTGRLRARAGKIPYAHCAV